MKKLTFTGLAVAALMAACQNEDTGNRTPNETNEFTPIELTEAETRMAKQTSDFAFRFFRTADAVLTSLKGSEQSIYLSPLSASYALSMATAGAEGQTLQELTEALGFTGFSVDEINAYNQKLLTELAGQDNTTTLKTANSFWMFDDFRALDTYQAMLQESYDAEVKTQPRETAKDAINDWCAEKTNGLIPKILEEMPDGVAMLINALYFKGVWETKFNKDNTRQEEFRCEDGSTLTVDMMAQQEGFRYMKDERMAAVKLPYGNRAFNLYVLLPNEGMTTSQLIAGLDPASWEEMQNNMRMKDVDLKLPRLKVESDANSLVETLEAMGVKKAFSRIEAEFGKMSDKDLYISSVQQTVSVTINEEGTEAAAVTDIGLDSADNPLEPAVFHANRPYVFVLEEESTGTILFVGKVQKP